MENLLFLGVPILKHVRVRKLSIEADLTTINHTCNTTVPSFCNIAFLRVSKGFPASIILQTNGGDIAPDMRVSECVNLGLMSHQQQGHMESGPKFKVSSERPILGLVV